MKTFTISCYADAVAKVTYKVKGENEKDASEVFQMGGGELIDQEFSVTKTDRTEFKIKETP